MFWIILGIIGVVIIARLTVLFTKGFRHILVGGTVILIFLCVIYCGFLVCNRIVAPTLNTTVVIEKTELLTPFVNDRTTENKYCWGRVADDGLHYFVMKKENKEVIEFLPIEARLIFINDEAPRVEHYHYYLKSGFARFMCGEYYCGDYAIIIPSDGYFEE